jgi:hypothetical protein
MDHADIRRYRAVYVELIRLQVLMTPDERVDLWQHLQQPYCWSCGRSDPMHRCQCWNDD